LNINKAELIDAIIIKLKKRVPGKWFGYYFAESSKLLVMRCSEKEFQNKYRCTSQGYDFIY